MFSFFRKPFVGVKPDIGSQLLALGEGGPSANIAALNSYIDVTVPVSGRHGFGFPNWQGVPRLWSNPVTVPPSSQQDYTVINGLMKVPGQGMIT